MTRTSIPRSALLAAAAWIIAGVGWLVDEAITAAAYPGYSYATNYISDLGIPEVGSFQGRTIDSPLHAVMNATFIGQGLLFALAGIAVYRAFHAGARKAFLTLALVHGAGLVLVGLIHGSAANVANGTAVFHVVGAAMAIIGANTAAIVVGLSSRRLGLSMSYRVVSVGLGILGILSLVMLEVDSSSTAINFFPDGVWERGAVYTVIAWELLTGVLLLVRSRSAKGKSATSAGATAQVNGAAA